MKKSRLIKCISVIFLVLFIFLPLLKAKNRLKVVAGIFPFQEFAREVGGNRIDADILLPPGVEAHSWTPTPSDIMKIQRADVFVYVGAVMAPHVHDILKGIDSKGLVVLDASKEVTLIKPDHEHGEAGETVRMDHHSHGLFDPHFWLDFENDIKIVNRIALVLSERDPAGEAYYAQNASAYNRKLKSMDARYQTELKDCRTRTFVFGGHAAFGYLAKRYGLSQISLYGTNPDSEPTPRKLAELVKNAREHGVRYIYFEELVSDKLARVMAKEVGAQTMVLNPCVNLTADQLRRKITFLDVMEQNLENLKKGLECGN
ncbi:MAG: zinc ABC transporter substrate-binding protein [Deltaproteobacteria bacterium]|jgi:zinc transport system substrate-binding protein|nr:zinc ABC transporter substrate-binding protein [Deltaproteobacteria bacterium]